MLTPDERTFHHKVPKFIDCEWPDYWTVTVRNEDGSVFCIAHGETEQQAVRRAQNICHAIEEVFG